MILDDNEDILELIRDVFIDKGYEVECLTSTNDIFVAINKIQPDLIILDYILSGINGGELCHQIKTNKSTSHIPVIMISGYQRVLESLGNYGADVFIPKPFDLDELINHVDANLNKANVA